MKRLDTIHEISQFSFIPIFIKNFLYLNPLSVDYLKVSKFINLINKIEKKSNATKKIKNKILAKDFEKTK